MSYKYVLTVTPGTQVSQILQSAQTVQAVKVTNGTPFDLDYSGLGATGLVVIPAGLEYMFYASDHLDGKCTILPVNNNNISGTGVVNINEYLIGEVLPKGTWPVTVPTQTVQAKVSTVTTLVNDGSSLGTQIIESTPSGAASSTISILNDGTVVIKGDVAGVLTTLLQLLPGAAAGASSVILGDANRTVEVLGKGQVDGALAVTGASTLTGATQINNTLGVTGLSSLAEADLSGILKFLTAANQKVSSHGGTLLLDASNDVDLILNAISGSVKSSNNFHALAGLMPDIAGTVHNGSVAGTATIYFAIWGASLKIFLCSLVGYNSATAFNFALPSNITYGWILSPNVGLGDAFLLSSTAQTIQELSPFGTATVNGTFTSATGQKTGSFGIVGAADTFQIGNTSSAWNGLYVFIGI